MKLCSTARRSTLSRSLRTEDVDGAVTPRLAASPDLLQHSSRVTTRPCSIASAYNNRNSVRRQLAILPIHERLHVPPIHHQLLDPDRLPPMLLLRPHPPPRSRPHPSHQLLHRKRLHQIIIRPDLQRMHPIVLRPRADTTTIGVPIPPSRAVSISFQPSNPGKIKSSTHTSAARTATEPNPPHPSQPTTDRTPPPANDAPSPAQSPHRPRRSNPGMLP